MRNKMLLDAFLLASSVVWAIPAATATPTDIDKYELGSFTADFTHLKPGGKVPPLYLTEEHAIKQWNLRNLPIPTAGTHQTYAGGAYVLVNDADAKITKAYDDGVPCHR